MVVDYWRKVAVAPRVEGHIETIGVDPPHPSALTLQEALGRLPERDRETFVLREVQGLSYAEIAAVHEATIESVRSRLRRARTQLRQALAAHLVGAVAPQDDEGDV